MAIKIEKKYWHVCAVGLHHKNFFLLKFFRHQNIAAIKKTFRVSESHFLKTFHASESYYLKKTETKFAMLCFALFCFASFAMVHN